MKNLLLVVMVLGALATNAQQQRYDPLFPVCSNQDPNSKEYREYFFEKIMSDLDYRETYLSYVNTELREKGQNVYLNGGKPLDSRYVQTIIDHTTYRMITIPEGVSFTNTRKNKHTGKVEEYEDFTQKEFMVGTFNYKTCHLTFLKANCFNFIKLHHLAPQIPLVEEKVPVPAPQIPLLEEKATLPAKIDTFYVRDTLRYYYKETIIEKVPQKSQEEIQAVHLSQSQSQSFSHSRSNSNDINYVRIEEGPQFSFGGNGNVFRRNYQSNGGPFGDVCDNANVVQGGLNVAFKGRRTVEAYNNNSASSSSTSTSSASASSLNQSGNQFGNANNQNQQNQNSQQSSGRRQPTYNPDPDPHNGKARTSDGF